MQPKTSNLSDRHGHNNPSSTSPSRKRNRRARASRQRLVRIIDAKNRELSDVSLRLRRLEEDNRQIRETASLQRWRSGIELETVKHLRQLLGEQIEEGDMSRERGALRNDSVVPMTQ
ncbi:hypothetical protein AAF712_015927, partial [Marasmius tenuissimus]